MIDAYNVYVSTAALDDWRAIAADGVRATEHYSAIKRTLRQAVEVEQSTAMTLVSDGYDPKRMYYAVDSPTRGRLVFVLRPNSPGETGHTLTRVLREQR